MEIVTANEAMEVLEKVGNGFLVPIISGTSTGDGDCYFFVGKYRVTVFMDAGGFDYIDTVRFPDGRVGKYDDWQVEGEVSAPEHLLAAKDMECCLRMERIFEVVAGLNNWGNYE